MHGGEIAVQAALHPSGNWITLPLTVGGLLHLDMVLDTGSPVSVISPKARDDLLGRQLLDPSTEGIRYRLAQLSVHEQPLPPLMVRVLPRLTRLQVDGLLGLDFLRLFEHVHFHVPTLQLVLELP